MEKESLTSSVEKATGDITNHNESRDSSCEAKCSNDDAKQQSKRKLLTTRILPFFGLQLALFIAALDMYVILKVSSRLQVVIVGYCRTILATSLPKIGSEFQAMTLSVWVASA